MDFCEAHFLLLSLMSTELIGRNIKYKSAALLSLLHSGTLPSFLQAETMGGVLCSIHLDFSVSRKFISSFQGLTWEHQAYHTDPAARPNVCLNTTYSFLIIFVMNLKALSSIKFLRSGFRSWKKLQ